MQNSVIGVQYKNHDSKVFIKRFHDYGERICDDCDAQSICQEVFNNGKNCPIVEEGCVWLEITEYADLRKIKEWVKDAY